MLLYDLVREHVEKTLRNIGPIAFGSQRLEAVNKLRRCQVYELSEVMPLFGDWEVERHKSVPKRPPFPLIWAEWHYVDSDPADPSFYDDYTLGAMIEQLPCTNIVVKTPNGSQVLDAELEKYRVTRFSRLNKFGLTEEGFHRRQSKSRAGSQPLTYQKCVDRKRKLQGLPVQDIATGLWSQSQSGDRCKFYSLVPHGADGRYNANLFLLEHLEYYGTYVGMSDQQASPWPAFMAFALLNCRNVTTDEHTPPKKLQQRCSQHRKPPRTTFKTLKIVLPRTRASSAGTQQHEGSPKRWHLCSGHFRELRSDKFTRKQGQWVWVQPHSRGDAELGQVFKNYQLTENQPAESAVELETDIA
jgi:hypothetical protein